MSNDFPYKIDVLYEDAGCLVVNKPPGLMVHADGRNEGPFLTDWFLARHPEAAAVGESQLTPEGIPIIRPGIVHRLDRETSGAIILAKTAEAHAALKQQFKDRDIAKKYLAFVWGELKEEFGTITRPIGRSGSDFRRWSAQPGARGEIREAETYWTRLWTGKAEVVGHGERGWADGVSRIEKFTLIEAEPKTGRTHQIRVHFQATHHPVVCDRLYAENQPQALGFARTALHAREVEFVNQDGKSVKVKAPLPEDFVGAYALLGIQA